LAQGQSAQEKLTRRPVARAPAGTFRFVYFFFLFKKNLAPFKMTLDLSSSIIKHFYKFYFFPRLPISFIAGVPAAQAGLGVSLLPLRRAAESHFLSGFRGRPQWYNNPPGKKKKKRFNLGPFSWMDCFCI
jgi:hypothetical protein